MVYFILRSSLFAFLLFPMFLMTVLTSAPVSEPCKSGPRFKRGAPLAGMIIENIEICGTFVGDPKPLKTLIHSKIKKHSLETSMPRARCGRT